MAIMKGPASLWMRWALSDRFCELTEEFVGEFGGGLVVIAGPRFGPGELAGTPIADNQNSVTAGSRGPVLLQDYQLIKKLAHQNRERIPERVVHAKGWGLQGTFTVTHDITKYTCAKIFSEIGKKTEVLSRWSTVAGERLCPG